MRSEVIKGLLTLSLLVSVFSPSINVNEVIHVSNNNFNLESRTNNKLETYDEHIFITGNEEFANTSTTRGWTGNGTSDSPYILENMNFYSDLPDGTYTIETALIHIRDTTTHFIMRNCNLERAPTAILLSNVQNANLSHNVFHSGVALTSSSNILVEENRFKAGIDFVNFGLSLANSSYINASRNTLIQCAGGFNLLSNSEKIVIAKNIVKECNFHGIALQSSQKNLIISNHFSGNNVLYDNNPGEISFYAASDNMILNNSFLPIKGYGANVDSNSNNNTFRFNNFIEFNAWDDGSNSNFDSNYWDFWTFPDFNQDGFVDNPLLIEGMSETVDSQPLTGPTELSLWQKPIILFPVGGEILTGSVTVRWSKIPQVVCTISISDVDGASWSVLQDNLDTEAFIWDTTTVTSFRNYILKIQAAYINGSELGEARSKFFTILNEDTAFVTEDLEGVYQSDSYSLTIKLENFENFRGNTSVVETTIPNLKTAYGTFTNIRITSFTDCAVISEYGHGYIDISNWNSYYSEDIEQVIKSESTWSINLEGYERLSVIMSYEYGNYELTQGSGCIYQETYEQRYYEDGFIQEITQCQDILSLEKIENISILDTNFECLHLIYMNYAGIAEPTTYIGQSRIWIDRTGTIIRQKTYDETDTPMLIMELLSTKKQPSTQRIPLNVISISLALHTLIIYKKKRK